ncbi:hypothetical protein [Uruburuella suis]|jgi:hypothetical protein|uniref:hypothetical protein n=1 Tax=Uruburuella suis TaxID=252130 RepID=UPI00249336E1|nr:hypothetical protein [Uruburuella suis]HRL34630.1 hypothetical protein [Neisseria sp.]
MAKIIITFEDSPEGVIVSANGARIPAAEKDRTEAQKLALLIRETLEEHYADSIKPIH